MTKKKLDLPKAVFHLCKGHPGVKYLLSAAHSPDGKPERTYYIRYRTPDGVQHFERAGKLATTPAKADGVRRDRSLGKELPNVVRREEKEAAKKAEAGKWTFDKLWTAWQRDPEQGHLNEKGEVDLTQGKRGTLKTNQRYVKHIKVPFGDREPKNLTSDNIDKFRLSLAKKYSRETTKSIIGLVTRLSRYGASKGYCAGLSFPIVLGGKALGKDPKQKRAPNAAEYAAYIETCKAWPDRQAGAFQLFIAFSGVRRGSVRNLKRADVDLVNKTALLRDSKTGDVKIALSNNAIALLREHLALPRNLGNPYIFTGSDPSGKRSQGQIDRIPRKIANAVGLPADLDPCHAFRRFLATRLKKYGTKVGMDAGGWRDPKMLLHYQSAQEDEVRDALNEEDAKIAETKIETA